MSSFRQHKDSRCADPLDVAAGGRGGGPTRTHGALQRHAGACEGFTRSLIDAFAPAWLSCMTAYSAGHCPGRRPSSFPAEPLHGSCLCMHPALLCCRLSASMLSCCAAACRCTRKSTSQAGSLCSPPLTWKASQTTSEAVSTSRRVPPLVCNCEWCISI